MNTKTYYKILKNNNIFLFFNFAVGVLIILILIKITKSNPQLEQMTTFTNPSPQFSHNVDQPINTTYSCKNMCSSQSKCYITGEQCTSDVDCTGCVPTYKNIARPNKNIRGNNEAGKYSFVSPTYSTLTTDIGTKAKLYNFSLAPIPQAYSGTDLWTKQANLASTMDVEKSDFIWGEENGVVDFEPKYKTRQSATGLFMDTGPLASNAYLSSLSPSN